MHTNHGISKPVSLFCVVWKSLLTPSSYYPLTIAATVTHSAGLGHFLLVCSPLTEQSWLFCVVLCTWVQSHYVPLQLGAGLGLCSGRSPFVTSTSELQASLVNLPLLCTHKRPQDTSLITVIVQALRVLRVLLSQTFRTYAFLNWKHYSYLCLSNTVFVQSSQKNRHTSMNFRSMKWLFSCIWNIFQFQAWFSN